MASFFANFDHFSKAQKHVQVKTASGGFLSLISLSIMGILFVSELVYWRTTRAEDHIVVDKSLGDRDVNIEMELHFHALGCNGARRLPLSRPFTPAQRTQILYPPPLLPLSPQPLQR